MIRVRAAVALLLAGCSVAACGGSSAGASPDPTGAWELVELWRGGVVEPAPAGARATLTVSDGTLGGTSYCNSYSGDYDHDGTSLTIAGLGGTEMGCAAEVMAAEAAYLEALGAVERIGSRDGYLVLTGPDVELRFRPLDPVPTSELTGTEWVLETLLDGEVASSTTGEPATLLLAEDGTLTGSTGCRTLSGTWVVAGDVVRLPDFGADGPECPPDVAAQDAQVAGVLGDGFQVVIAGDSLTVTGRDGLGLVYKAG